MIRDWLKRRLLAVWRRLPGWAQGRLEWLMLPKWLVGAVAVVLDDQERVLLFRHTYRDEYPWGFPGGWLKPGEDPNRGIEREVLEEAGYHIRTRHPLVIGGDRALGRLDLIFLCELVDNGDAFQPSPEVSDAGFFALSELPGRVEPFHVQVATYAVEVVKQGILRPPTQDPR
ncbi:MAG: NUDIX hydrolase [Anaerolineae bacterium]